jgi:hypothetical protein
VLALRQSAGALCRQPKMATLHQSILDEFIAELTKAPEFDKDKIDRLKQLLAGKKKLKPEELVTVFSLPQGGDLK